MKPARFFRSRIASVAGKLTSYSDKQGKISQSLRERIAMHRKSATEHGKKAVLYSLNSIDSATEEESKRRAIKAKKHSKIKTNQKRLIARHYWKQKRAAAKAAIARATAKALVRIGKLTKRKRGKK